MWLQKGIYVTGFIIIGTFLILSRLDKYTPLPPQKKKNFLT